MLSSILWFKGDLIENSIRCRWLASNIVRCPIESAPRMCLREHDIYRVCVCEELFTLRHTLSEKQPTACARRTMKFVSIDSDRSREIGFHLIFSKQKFYFNLLVRNGAVPSLAFTDYYLDARKVHNIYASNSKCKRDVISDLFLFFLCVKATHKWCMEVRTRFESLFILRMEFRKKREKRT